MPLDSLKHLYIDQLQDLYSADRQARAVVKEMCETASDADLKDALNRGINGIEDGMQALKDLITRHGADPTDEHCKGMEGLATEARKHAVQKEFGAEEVRDASIITQYQRMAHYAIAGYGTALAFARRLDLVDDVKVLQECLDATYHGDGEMSAIAEGHVNEKAA